MKWKLKEKEKRNRKKKTMDEKFIMCKNNN